MSGDDQQPIAIVGSGPQARTVIDILIRNGNRYIAGIADIEREENIGESRNGIEIRWTADQLIANPIDAAIIVAYGDRDMRKKLVAKFKSAGYGFTSAISDAAYIADTARIGTGTIVNPSATVMPNAIIGDHVLVCSNSVIEHDNIIGDYSTIAPGVSTGGRVKIGEGSYVFTGATLIPDVTIGAWATVGAGAVVINDVTPGKTVVGNPARAI